MAVKITICILTCNRETMLEDLLMSLMNITYRPLEIIVVDNGSTEKLMKLIQDKYKEVIYFKNKENLGIEGRNVGLKKATGNYIITIDDDIFGITDEAIQQLIDIFNKQPNVGAVCFKVLDTITLKVINWCHHLKIEDYADKSFITNEITEGAVAFRRTALPENLYPSYFFISHEGHDLALRIMNNGFDVFYHPKIIVKHYHSPMNRTAWRRYYFDTRNLIWLAVRNYPICYGIKYIVRGLLAMLIYSIRDGFLYYWFKALIDGIIHIRIPFNDRSVITNKTLQGIKKIDRNRPSLSYMIRKRLFHREVKI